MSFDWAKYLQLSKILIEDENAHEAVYRTAISRAYYAAFCMCRNFARDNNEIIPRGDVGDHNFVIDHFKKSSVSARGKIGSLLDRLRRNRNLSDYDDDDLDKPLQLARYSVRRATEILRLLENLSEH